MENTIPYALPGNSPNRLQADPMKLDIHFKVYVLCNRNVCHGHVNERHCVWLSYPFAI